MKSVTAASSARMAAISEHSRRFVASATVTSNQATAAEVVGRFSYPLADCEYAPAAQPVLGCGECAATVVP
jgi:hypothetical protein